MISVTRKGTPAEETFSSSATAARILSANSERRYWGERHGFVKNRSVDLPAYLHAVPASRETNGQHKLGWAKATILVQITSAPYSLYLQRHLVTY